MSSMKDDLDRLLALKDRVVAKELDYAHTRNEHDAKQRMLAEDAFHAFYETFVQKWDFMRIPWQTKMDAAAITALFSVSGDMLSDNMVHRLRNRTMAALRRFFTGEEYEAEERSAIEHEQAVGKHNRINGGK